MIYEIINTLLLMGAVQGFIFSSFAFFSKKYRSLSSYFLGALILTFSYNIIQNYLVISEIVSNDHLFDYFYIPFTPVFLVLFYFYVRTYLYPSKKFKRTDYLLFLPFLIAFSGSVIEKTRYSFFQFSDVEIKFFNYFRFSQEVFSLLYSVALIIFSYRLIKKFEKEQKGNPNKKSKVQYNWLKIITFILLLLCFYWILPLFYELQFKFHISVKYFYFLWLGLAVTIYLLGHIGLFQYGILKERVKIDDIRTSQSEKTEAPTIISAYKNDYIGEFERIVKYEKGYLNSDFTLDLAALKLNLSKSYLSRIINAELNVSFNDYVNKLRIEEAIRLMDNPEFKNYNLLSIGLEAGFNSKSTFYNSFKKFTGISPSEYKKKNG